ncbi:MAG: hypothetical protein AAFQ89_15600 [Cyanobacteria bacterium J06626_18]
MTLVKDYESVIKPLQQVVCKDERFAMTLRLRLLGHVQLTLQKTRSLAYLA